MAKRKKTDKSELTDAAPPNNPFAAALAGMSAPEADLDAVSDVKPAKKAKLDVRTVVDRKGRRGKAVTLVHGLEALGADERDDIARSLKKALGTGVSAEGPTLVVQGELGERIKAWFDARET